MRVDGCCAHLVQRTPDYLVGTGVAELGFHYLMQESQPTDLEE